MGSPGHQRAGGCVDARQKPTIAHLKLKGGHQARFCTHKQSLNSTFFFTNSPKSSYPEEPKAIDYRSRTTISYSDLLPTPTPKNMQFFTLLLAPFLFFTAVLATALPQPDAALATLEHSAAALSAEVKRSNLVARKKSGSKGGSSGNSTSSAAMPALAGSALGVSRLAEVVGVMVVVGGITYAF